MIWFKKISCNLLFEGEDVRWVRKGKLNVIYCF